MSVGWLLPARPSSGKISRADLLPVSQRACEHLCLRNNSGHTTDTRTRGLANCPDTKWKPLSNPVIQIIYKLVLANSIKSYKVHKKDNRLVFPVHPQPAFSGAKNTCRTLFPMEGGVKPRELLG